MTDARTILAGVLVLTAAIAPRAVAAPIETLLMPGKVAAAHARIEQDCMQCHDRANRERQAQLCSACHKDVAADVRAGTGWHGRLPNVGRIQCSSCHTEHLGRDGDIVHLSPLALDHTATDFPLEDRHASVPCSSCHASGKRYREAPRQCAACHRDDDAHSGRLGPDCGKCHAARGWSDTRFDHHATGYDLRGRHASLACATCHAANRYDGTPTRCVSCHAPDDAHQGARGADCASCHDEVRWKASGFDHARAANFALLGAHAQLACGACHKSKDLHDALPRDCAGCHVADDAHASRLGPACDRCHSSTSWAPAAFDHARDAHLALEGRHATLDCHACHTASVAKQKLSHECQSCHRADDVHVGQLGAACDQCHGLQAWTTGVEFDHDFTQFPLVGLHVAVPCVQCHATREFRGTATDCYACHKRDDQHKGSLGRQCADCHTPNGWNLWRFDHARATGFALAGAHDRLECDACHREPPDRVKLRADCASCHLRDDVHHGQFGRQCERCHNTTTFKGARRQ
jgi:hypothetical protein